MVGLVGGYWALGHCPIVTTLLTPCSPSPCQVIGPHGRKVQASWIEIRSSSGCGTMTGIFVLAQTGYVKLLPLVLTLPLILTLTLTLPLPRTPDPNPNPNPDPYPQPSPTRCPTSSCATSGYPSA